MIIIKCFVNIFQLYALMPSLTLMTAQDSVRKKFLLWMITVRVTRVKWRLENMPSVILGWMEILPALVRDFLRVIHVVRVKGFVF